MGNLVSVKRASEMLGVTPWTIRNWDRLGKIKTVRSPGNQRKIDIEEVLRIQQGVTVQIDEKD